MKLTHILERSVNLNKLFLVKIIMVSDPSVNKTEIINELRGVQGVVFIKVRQNELVAGKGDDLNEYTLLEMKFISNKDTPEATLESIKKKSFTGDEGVKKILGLKKLYTIKRTIKQLSK
jgi:hypothetical protein